MFDKVLNVPLNILQKKQILASLHTLLGIADVSFRKYFKEF